MSEVNGMTFYTGVFGFKMYESLKCTFEYFF